MSSDSLIIMDISQNAPTVIGQIGSFGTLFDIAISGATAYLGGYNTLGHS